MSAFVGDLEGGGEVSGQLVDLVFAVSKGKVELGAHRIKEHSQSQQFQHHGTAALSIGSEPVTVAIDRSIKERSLSQGAITQHLCRLARLIKRLAKRRP